MEKREFKVLVKRGKHCEDREDLRLYMLEVMTHGFEAMFKDRKILKSALDEASVKVNSALFQFEKLLPRRMRK